VPATPLRGFNSSKKGKGGGGRGSARPRETKSGYRAHQAALVGLHSRKSHASRDLEERSARSRRLDNFIPSKRIPHGGCLCIFRRGRVSFNRWLSRPVSLSLSLSLSCFFSVSFSTHPRILLPVSVDKAYFSGRYLPARAAVSVALADALDAL